MVKAINQYHDLIINAPFGAIGISIESDYVVSVDLLLTSAKAHVSSSQFAKHVSHQVRQYLEKMDLSLQVPYVISGTPFQRRVWAVVSKIPTGNVLTYSELAQKVGSGPRAVANACGANKLPLLIPCHRVVAKKGLGGFMQGNPDGLMIKEWLLAHESK